MYRKKTKNTDMFQGVSDTIEWFGRTQKKGFRLSQGKFDIAEYFDPEASNQSASDQLKKELEHLRGGTYHIDAKDSSAEPRKILSTDFIILPRGETVASIGATFHSSSIPNGYVSRDDMDRIIEDKMNLRILQEQNERLQTELQNAYVPAPTMMDSIGSILEHPMVKQLAPILIAKIMGGSIPEPVAYQVGIAGTDKKVEPVSNEPVEDDGFLELTDDQETRLNVAFDSLVATIGDVEETLVLLECLAPYVQEQNAMFNVIKGELLKYKK
jgi:hypothetical protein